MVTVLSFMLHCEIYSNLKENAIIEYAIQYPGFNKKSLRIPKGQSESVHRRRIDNRMTNKRTKGQTTIHKTYTQNQRSGNTNPTKTRVQTQVFRKGNQFLLH
jgi:hypothetical protein